MKNHSLRQALHVMQWVALTFVLVLGVLMAHDAVRSKQTLNAGLKQLDELKLQDLEDPALAATVRDLDYLYRATYFQTRDKQAHGFLLLGVGLLTLCALLAVEQFLFAQKLKIPQKIDAMPEKERKAILWFSLCGLLILTALLVLLRPPRPPQPHMPPSLPPAKEIILADAMEAETHHWPQFRGSVLPNRNALPATWDFQEKWRVKIPLPGFSSPVVWGDTVFVSGGERKERAIFAFDAASGALRWSAATLQVARYPDLSEDTGVAAPTLAVDAERVYAIFATGEMLCCTHDGTVVWRKQLPWPEILYGYASSLLLLGDKLIVQYDMEPTQTVYALNVHTGETVWKTEREAASSWSSPVAVLRDSGPMLFTSGNRTAEVIDAQTGKLVWQQACMGGEVATAATAKGEVIYFSNTGAFTGAFAVGDGRIIYNNDNVPAPDVASPVLFGDVYLLFTSGGSVIALNTANGEELYEENFDNGFYASPIMLQNKIVAVNLDGELLLLSADKEKLTVEGRFALETKVVAIPAFHQGGIIMRTFDNDLIRLEAKP